MKSRGVLVTMLCIGAVLALASCGTAQRPTSGVYGIAVWPPVGMMTAPPTPRPLPSGFGMSTMVPFRHATIVVKARSGDRAGEVVARTKVNAKGVFWVPLPPGAYVVFGAGYLNHARGFRVRPHTRTRVVVWAGDHW